MVRFLALKVQYRHVFAFVCALGYEFAEISVTPKNLTLLHTGSSLLLTTAREK